VFYFIITTRNFTSSVDEGNQKLLSPDAFPVLYAFAALAGFKEAGK